MFFPLYTTGIEDYMKCRQRDLADCNFNTNDWNWNFSVIKEIKELLEKESITFSTQDELIFFMEKWENLLGWSEGKVYIKLNHKKQLSLYIEWGD